MRRSLNSEGLEIPREHTQMKRDVSALATILAFALLAFGLTLSCAVARAQSGAGSIQGTVTDPTGAVILGASVQVVNQANGEVVNSKSNNAGFYQAPGLFAGGYTITVTAPNMKTYSRRLDLLVAQNAVVNASLTPGSVSQKVEVSANTVQLTTTDNGTISADLDSKRIDQLPMNIRELSFLTIETTAGLESKGTGNLMVHGLEGESMEFVADGVPLTNRQFGGINQVQGTLPDPDAVAEVRVETTDVGAQYATPGVAIIETKSGTNSIHGSLFETARNNAIGIAKNRNNISGYAAPHLVRNEFGASAGGPIVIPHVYDGHNKSFWFGAYERYSLSNAAAELVAVPTVAERGGDFSGLTNGSGVYQQLYDPNTTHSDTNCNGTGQANPYCRAPFGNGILGSPQNNQIPLSRLSPTSKILYDITPLPGNANNPNVTGSNLSTVNPTYTVIPNYSLRLDHYFNENNRAYVRFTGIQITSISLRNNPSSPASLAVDGLPADANGIASSPTDTFAGAVGFTHVFSPSFFSETILSQQWFTQHNLAGGTPLADFEKQLGLPNNFGEPGFPEIGDAQILNGNGGFDGTQYQYGLSQIIQTLDENMTKNLGRHQLQFGGRYRHERFGDLPDEIADSVNFNGQGTQIYNPSTGTAYSGLANTGSDDSDFFLGNASSYNVTGAPPYEHAHDYEFDAYFQDNFRVRSNLTLNLGLRWEDHPAFWVKNGIFNSFDYKNDAVVLSAPPSTLIAEGYTTQAIITNMENIGAKYETPQQAGLPSTLVEGYPWNFLPRLGFAWQPFGTKVGTVLRGGYGRYIYPVPTRSYLKLPIQNNPLVVGYGQSFTSSNQTPDGLPNAQLRFPQGSGPWSPTSPFLPIMGVNTTNVVNSSTLNAILPGVGLTTVSPDLPPDVATETNLTLEQPLKGNSAIRVSWIYTHGSDLDHYYQPNNAPSAFVWEMMTDTAVNTANGSEATRPYDHTTWGGNTEVQKNGWSNDNALEVNYERRFHAGIAYQIIYDWSKAFRIGGNAFRDSTVDPAANYLGLGGIAPGTSYNTNGITNFIAGGQIAAPALPPPPPAGTPLWEQYHALNRFEDYIVDTAVPKQHVKFNGIIDLPFGRNKRFLGNVNRWENEIVGGWQIAGDGQVISQDFAVANGNWGTTNPIHYYKHGLNITDCQSTCQPAKLWFNGFIAPTTGAMAKISGLPSGYTVGSASSPAYSSPINFTGTNGVITGTNNNVTVTGPKATFANQGFSPGPIGSNPFSHTVLNGPFNYNVDLSAFKVFSITDTVNLRVNVDAFNAFNIQGYNNPNTTTGEILYAPGAIGASSYWTPRQLQLTARVTF
jgi:hypothetical protein